MTTKLEHLYGRLINSEGQNSEFCQFNYHTGLQKPVKNSKKPLRKKSTDNKKGTAVTIIVLLLDPKILLASMYKSNKYISL